ncbi:hydantoinase B/oxoprolinase family protein [Acidipila rosea]|uniref:N-methylhydantoinase B n=1 Tax=Acidipila rosea TaxID=768535 RepID=A0A4R1L191_9BACT|nr:hydantoinase B/oxoprolinase family protein [Acidipila rosea]TCK71695.1 N-methylhydantoinase B [Acidipila rosea]
MSPTESTMPYQKPISLIDVSIFKSATHSIAEEMGAALRRTAFSPNIKERRDYSCAVFDGDGQVIAMGDHMPVHLGSMPMSVKAAITALTLERGDIAILNDPYQGGTHLPDITMVVAIFSATSETPVFYAAARAHHADVGGQYPGSMGLCREIYQEGLRIPPVKIVRRGEINSDLLRMILDNVRTPLEREGDLQAQIGACHVAELRLAELIAKYQPATIRLLCGELLNYSERLTRAELSRMPAGSFEAEDVLDDDGAGSAALPIHVRIDLDPATATAHIDFSGSSPQVASSLNAVLAITYSAVYYVFRCLLPVDAPATAGLMRPVTLTAPKGSIVNAELPGPVAGGNVETSQRIVDVLLRALAKAIPERIPAASSGTMSNLTIGGVDPRSGSSFAYYETTAGGMGAMSGWDGLSGVHTHMTNSLNTPVEALEYAYPLRVLRYSYRPGSGGRGLHRGGNGLIKEVELLADAQVTLLADRQKTAPYGLNGGEPGMPGKISHLHNGETTQLPGKCSIPAAKGDVIRLETPGGGGWGQIL